MQKQTNKKQIKHTKLEKIKNLEKHMGHKNFAFPCMVAGAFCNLKTWLGKSLSAAGF